MYSGTPLLEIPRPILNAMVGHCLRGMPNEACGILAGARAPRVEAFYPLRNELASRTRYNADPGDLIAAIQSMRAERMQMLAIYHSHPDTQAVPSRIDLAQNHYGPLPRIIISLQNAVPEVRIWRLEADDFEELAWRILSASVESESRKN